MSQYKPYPAYKDSGVEWLGRVPEHWQVKRLKHIATVQTGMAKGKDHEGKDTIEVPYLRVANVQDGYLSLDDVATMEIPREELARYSLQPGDVLMNEGGDFDKLGRGSVWQGEIEPCIHQNHVFAVRPFAVSSAWLNAFTGSLTAQFYFMGRAKQSTNLASISSSSIMELPVVVPPEVEIDLLLSQLDRETARIDALIEKKTRFIELLREKRQALITHAVTKGLDPNLKMKDSGVEWLGEVPEHWAVCKLSFRYSVELGKMLDEKRITSASLRPYLRNQDVQWGQINTESLPEMDIHSEELSRYTVLNGDLLVCEGGDVGRAAIWRGENGVIGYQKALHRLRPRNDVADTAEFFFFALMAAKLKGVFDESDSKATIAHLPAEKFRQYRFAFPPEYEQREIAFHIRTQTQRLEKILSTTEHSITLLKERRSALITAAVTGQIDLREAV
ncbi:type I restriction endonuclease subunit S [Pseudomonas sp. C11]|uniref:restriction endonuclease subunit S n=1 Tax=Pseudomonas sp. C11 TaxID=3075550 RepID=UPI002AFFF5A3|nr:type I restriction endonuclease subunit S [Pseudomonas sp. C11]